MRNKFADKAAGWAHSVLFAAELPQFRSLLPTTLQQEMKIYIEQRNYLIKRKIAITNSIIGIIIICIIISTIIIIDKETCANEDHESDT